MYKRYILSELRLFIETFFVILPIQSMIKLTVSFMVKIWLFPKYTIFQFPGIVHNISISRYSTQHFNSQVI